jgi:ribosomal protein S18 acetylase RimI-like enzyme
MIRQVTEATPAVAAALERLIRQLSPSAGAPDIEAILGEGIVRLLVAEDDAGEIVGTLSLALFHLPGGLHAQVEDVVVDAAARGRGFGRELTLAAIRLAREAGARSVDLTSRPSREAANALYRSLGFVERTTNVYRFELD